MIKTENLTMVYNGNKAVDGLNLEIAEGDIFGFLGPNGAGKSTTILMLVGMIEPTEGKCFINDIEVAKNPLKVKKIIGYLPENVGFYGNMTAEQNLAYFARFYATMDENERKKRIGELLELVQLDGVSQKVGGYSRGMNQRLGQTLKKLSDEGKTIFFSSHILAEVAQVCKTIGIISNGTLIERGTLEEIKMKLDVRRTVKIIVETTTEEMPEIEHENIVTVEYKGRRAVIEAKSDIREYISRYLLENNIGIKELRIEEPTLEDVFMESVYKKPFFKKESFTKET
jgi:ABC-2 type transport system ATP-binding protein